MAWLGTLFHNFHNYWNNVNTYKTQCIKDPHPLRIGVLGAAVINYPAIIDPCQTHPGATIVALAARDISRAEAQIIKHNLGPECKAYGSYDALVQDPDVQAVYIPLPNGLHAEWAIAALQAGKHVLLEKPFTSNEAEARRVAAAAQDSGRVCLEAFHWRFHPAVHRVRELVLLQSGTYGSPVKISARLELPRGIMGEEDIRWKYGLAGGSCMDFTYVFSAATVFAVDDFSKKEVEFEVLEAEPRVWAGDERIDEAMHARFLLSYHPHHGPDGHKRIVECETSTDFAIPPLWGFIPRLDRMMPLVKIECEEAEIEFTQFVGPGYGHEIRVKEKATGKKYVEKRYTDGPLWGKRGQDWWTTYRYQLEAFVGMVREKEGGEKYHGPCVPLEDSVKLMGLIDAVYEKAGMPKRGA